MFFLSLRHLLSRKSQTMLILLGISFATMLYVVISSVQLGMREYIMKQLLNNTSHILIEGRDHRINAVEVLSRLYSHNDRIIWSEPPGGLRRVSDIEQYQSWKDEILLNTEVKDFSPRLALSVVFKKGKFTTSAKLIGTIPEKQIRISEAEKYMKEGSFHQITAQGDLILASGIAHDLGVQKGSFVQVYYGDIKKTFRVVGIIHFGNEQVDRLLSFTHLLSAQLLARRPGHVGQIAVELNDINKSSELAKSWRSRGIDKVQNWIEANQNFMEMIKVQDFVRYFITIAILIVSSFGIYNVLSIMINHKKKEIAILRAIGFEPKQIITFVLYQGCLLGFFGGLFGALLGYFLSIGVEHLKLNLELGGENHLPVNYLMMTYLVGFFSALISSCVASVIPALSAGRMQPIEILRREI